MMKEWNRKKSESYKIKSSVNKCDLKIHSTKIIYNK